MCHSEKHLGAVQEPTQGPLTVVRFLDYIRYITQFNSAIPIWGEASMGRIDLSSVGILEPQILKAIGSFYRRLHRGKNPGLLPLNTLANLAVIAAACSQKATGKRSVR